MVITGAIQDIIPMVTEDLTSMVMDMVIHTSIDTGIIMAGIIIRRHQGG